MTWLRLVYGTAILTALSGTAIYYGGTRTVVKPIDIVELHEAAYERLMPFGYTLVTNEIRYGQAKWTVDPSTNRWQSGTNQVPYMIYAGVQSVTDQFICVKGGIAIEGGGVAGIISDDPYFWWDAENWWDSDAYPAPSSAAFQNYSSWDVSVIQTGRTQCVGYYMGRTNELPAYVCDVHPRGVGVYNKKASLDWIDGVLTNVIPSYVDHEAAVGGLFTNDVIPMLTVSSVWHRLDLPYVWTNITKTATNTYSEWVDSWTNELGIATNVARIGTNAAWACSTNITTNFSFTTGPICTTNMLTERFRVAAYLRWTKQTWAGSPYDPNNSQQLAWTNAAMNLYTNSATNTYSISTNVPTGANVTNELGVEYGYPTWLPEWWSGTVSNPAPEEWRTPATTATIDDTTNGIHTLTNLPYGYPERQFRSTGTLSKWQVFEHSYGSYVSFGTNDTFTNAVMDTVSHPRVRVPYNVSAIPVTGEIYGTLHHRGYDTWLGYPIVVSNRMWMASTNMTSPTSNSFWWVGAPVDIPSLLDVFPATNYPCSFSWGVDYFVYSSWWGANWNAWTGYSIRDLDVVFKWTFSRCKP